MKLVRSLLGSLRGDSKKKTEVVEANNANDAPPAEQNKGSMSFLEEKPTSPTHKLPFRETPKSSHGKQLHSNQLHSRHSLMEQNRPNQIIQITNQAGISPGGSNPLTQPMEIIIPLPPRKVDFRSDTKQVQDELSDYLRKQLVTIHKEKRESIRIQKSLLEKLGIEVKEPELSEQRTKKLLKMKELGVRLEEVSLDLERRYESMFVGFNNLLENLKLHIVNILNDQKKEIFSTLATEKAQNVTNIHSLENRLHEAVYLSSLENKTFLANENCLTAFKQFFKFAKEFKTEFYDFITSGMAAYNQKDLHNDTSKYFSQQLAQSLVAPKAFPSELFRFFEQTASKPQGSSHPNSGSFVNAHCKFPSEMIVDLSTKSFPLNIPRVARKGKDSGRAYVLFAWADSHTLVMAGEKTIRVVRLAGCKDNSYTPFDEETHAADNVNIVALWEGSVINPSNPDNPVQIQCVSVARFESKTLIVVGSNDAVGRV